MPTAPPADALNAAISCGTPASRHEALFRLAALIRSKTQEEDLFETLASELHQVVSFDGIGQHDFGGPSDSSLRVIRFWSAEPYNERVEANPVSAIPKEETVSWWIYQNQQPVVIQVRDGDARFESVVRWLAKIGLRSLFAVPLSTAHRKLGSLVFVSHIEDAYSVEDQRFLSLVADQIALAMDDARAQARLRLLLDITNRIVTKLELRDLLRETAESTRQVMKCNAVSVTLPDPENGELRRYAMEVTRSRYQEIVDSAPVSAQHQRVFRTGQALSFTKEQLALDPIVIALGTKSVSLSPLISRERVLGVLGVGSTRENAFTEDDLAYLGQVANQVAIAVENSRAYGEISQLKDRLARENVYLESEIRSELHFDAIVGNSEQLHRVLKEIETAAPADCAVLIYGETGTGKELIARAVHNLSGRGSNAFVKLNCAAIPTGLLESELFGHEKGAFTGAIAQRVGRFELANRGTIFLDEVGEIPLELQPKLLRVLQEREFERLGSTRTLRTDARLIAATNRDLETMVEEQRFRSDLYYRLNVFPIRVPSLRERKEDIPLLVRYFVKEFSRRNNRVIETIPSETMQALVRYQWPGNIRELQNVIERAVIISKGSVLNVPLAELHPKLSTKGGPDRTRSKTLASPENLHNVLETTERTQILRALEEAHGVVAGPDGAAARLGLKRSTLRFKMQRLGIQVSRTTVDGGS